MQRVHAVILFALSSLLSAGCAAAQRKAPAPSYAIHSEATAGDDSFFGAEEAEVSDGDATVASVGGAMPARRARLARAAPPPPPGNAQPAVEPVDETPAPAPAEQKRLVVYKGNLDVLVPDADVARMAFQQKVDAMGGHLQSLQNTTLTVRVPAARFHEAVDALRQLGKVSRENISSQDVTRAVFELGLRIENTEQARDRLVLLLTTTTDLSQVLQLERELAQRTEEIEMLKAKRRTLQGEAAFSTLTARFMANAPQPKPSFIVDRQSPFPWIRQIGPASVANMATDADFWSRFWPGTGVDLPEEFLVLADFPAEKRAISAQGTRVWVRTFGVFGGDLDFWVDAVKRDLVQGRGMVLVDDANEGALTFTTRVGGRPVDYHVTLELQHTLLGPQVRVVESISDRVPEREAEVTALRKALQG